MKLRVQNDRWAEAFLAWLNASVSRELTAAVLCVGDDQLSCLPIYTFGVYCLEITDVADVKFSLRQYAFARSLGEMFWMIHKLTAWLFNLVHHIMIPVTQTTRWLSSRVTWQRLDTLQVITSAKEDPYSHCNTAPWRDVKVTQHNSLHYDHKVTLVLTSTPVLYKIHARPCNNNMGLSVSEINWQLCNFH